MKGWTKTHRKIFDNPVMRKPNNLAVWVYLISNANHNENEIFWNNEIIRIERGQLITSIKGIAKYFNLGIATISRILSIFEHQEMIKKHSNNKFTMITICNYDKYQSEKTVSKPMDTNHETKTLKTETKKTTKPLDNKGRNEFENEKRKPSGNQAETNKNDKNDKNNINVQNEFERPTIFPLNNKPDKEELLRIEFEKFWNYYNKKVSRKKCLIKWKRLSVTDKNKIKEHLPEYIKSTPDIQYRKNPLTYLNNESWNDEIINKTNAVEYNQQYSLVNQIGVQQ